MKKMMLCVLSLFTVALWGVNVTSETALELVQSRLIQLYPQHNVSMQETLSIEGETLAYVFYLEPVGYMVVSAKEELPPLLAYSGTSTFSAEDGSTLLADLIITDLSNRLLSGEEGERNRVAWQTAFSNHRFEQWPPAGYSPTEGWLKTLWTQSAPYNWMCPIDPVTSNRSVAGCPAVAMSQIVHFHQALNGTRFTDADDYYHNYSGRTYWIDNDYALNGFPSFPHLNDFLDVIDHRYRYQEDLSDSLKAALIFATGTALRQVYSSSGSGTFGVNQAYVAFQRFNFPGVELLTDTSPDLYTRMENNVKNAQPVHLAVVTPAWDMGHNVVVDGYNTDNYYHLNFGWGGSYNGWYLLPSQIPYGLTVVEGAIVDIAPYQYAFCVPDTLVFAGASSQSLEIINMHDGSITVENLVLSPELIAAQWSISPSQTLPAVIPQYGMMSFTITYNPLGVRESFLSSLRLILEESAMDIPIRYSTTVASDDLSSLPNMLSAKAYPNPFNPRTTISYTIPESGHTTVAIYNTRGQLVRHLVNNTQPAGMHNAVWDGTSDNATSCASGVYFCRISTEKHRYNIKLLMMK